MRTSVKLYCVFAVICHGASLFLIWCAIYFSIKTFIISNYYSTAAFLIVCSAVVTTLLETFGSRYLCGMPLKEFKETFKTVSEMTKPEMWIFKAILIFFSIMSFLSIMLWTVPEETRTEALDYVREIEIIEDTKLLELLPPVFSEKLYQSLSDMKHWEAGDITADDYIASYDYVRNVTIVRSIVLLISLAISGDCVFIMTMRRQYVKAVAEQEKGKKCKRNGDNRVQK